MAMPITTSVDYDSIVLSSSDEDSNDSPRRPDSGPSIKNRLAEIPPEILMEIMKWVSVSEKSETSVLSLGCTSRQFSATLKAFGAESWVKENTISGKLHNHTTDWVHWHLHSLGYRPRGVNTNSLEDLKSHLTRIAEITRNIKDQTCSFPLDVNKKFKEICCGDWLSTFQAYQGPTLSVNTFGQTFSLDLILQIEKALPSDVAMHVIVPGFAAPLNDAALAGFITKLCADKRPVSFEFPFVEFDKFPLAEKALIDVLCGQGFIMELFVNGHGGNDHLLKALATYCDQLRHVQLIGFEGATDLSHQDIEGLAEALERRRANGGSHVTIALSCLARYGLKFEVKVLASNEKIAHLESIGLYFGKLDGTEMNHNFVQKVSNSTGHGAVDLVRRKMLPAVVEVESDDDSIIVSSDDEFSSDESEDETRVQQRRKPARPSQAEPTSEPKLKKRDKCVVS